MLPDSPGVYLMKDRLGTILYVGKAKSLRKRVSSYFQSSRSLHLEQPKVAAMVQLVRDIAFIEVKNESEALLLEGKLIKEWRPRYNTVFTDDKRFLLVRVSMRETLPRFRLVRFKKDESSLYFGPFAHSGMLRKTLAEMRTKFGILLGDANPVRLEDGSYLLYDDVRSEIYGHPNRVTVEEYLARVDQACDFLEGRAREWLQDLEVEMKRAAENREYEKAADLRDRLQALQRTLTKTRKFAHSPRLLLNHHEILTEAARVLGLSAPPLVIECFDVSHISGTYCVASMVRFADGAPDKANYRRFRIQTFVGNDDYRAMCEVVGRRYRRLQAEEKPFPDLLVIDGGRGQVSAALRAFLESGIEPPPLIGLAKKRETIIFPDAREPLQLEDNDPVRLMLQRVRDEAHRFANTYSADLRRRRMRETILDEFEGLGKVRREALMKHFGSLERLKKASEAELQEVDGIGPKLASRLRAFLQDP